MGLNPIQSVYRPIPGTSQDITSSGTAANNSTALGNSRILRITATQAIRYRVGPLATAVATDTFLPAGAVEYVGYVPGDRISVIQVSAGGTVNITECTR